MDKSYFGWLREAIHYVLRFVQVAWKMGQQRTFSRLRSSVTHAGLPTWRRMLALTAIITRVVWLVESRTDVRSMFGSPVGLPTIPAVTTERRSERCDRGL